MKTGKYLVKITKALAWMPEDKYIQEVMLYEGNNKVYISKGSAGHISISIKNIKIIKPLN